MVYFEEVYSNHVERKEVTDRLQEIISEGGSIISCVQNYSYSDRNSLFWRRYEIIWKKP